jgi:hypothetical protein
MLELIGLILCAAAIGAVVLGLWLLLLPFYLLFRLFGFAIKLTLSGAFLVLVSLLVLPIALLVGAILIVKIVLIALPLLIFALLVWGVLALVRPSRRAAVVSDR